ncbi:mCG1051096 [Mus musculus]|nr:mCG1051096 [Mus musculus]
MCMSHVHAWCRKSPRQQQSPWNWSYGRLAVSYHAGQGRADMGRQGGRDPLKLHSLRTRPAGMCPGKCNHQKLQLAASRRNKMMLTFKRFLPPRKHLLCPAPFEVLYQQALPPEKGGAASLVEGKDQRIVNTSFLSLMMSITS